MFEPSRLSFARQRRGLTLTRLAAAVGVSRETLSAYENGRWEPKEDVLRALARQLAVPVAFFGGESIEPLSEAAVSFRCSSRMTAAQRNAALTAGRIGVEFMTWIDRKFHLPIPDVPSLPDLAPEIAADVVRARWGLGAKPIGNMVHLLEAHGARVLRLPVDCDTVDAFSAHVDATPYVFLTNRKSPERTRFDAAHELGHLVLHSEHRVPAREDEDAANTFASAFLMPKDGVLAVHRGPANAEQIIRSKRMWRVSAMALARRLHDVGLLSEWRYRDACVHLSRAGYRRGEPEGMDSAEDSLLLRKVLDLMRAEKMPFAVIAADLGLNVDELYSYVSGLAPVVLRGGGQTSPRRRSHLRLVD